MPAARRKATACTTAGVVGVVGVTPLALTALAAGPAVAHGPLDDREALTPYVALAGAVVLALGSSLLFAAARRPAARHGR